MKNKIQVKREHYFFGYDNPERFSSYFTQINEALKIKPKKTLEIGIGNKTVSNYLKQSRIKIVTCDFDKDLEPDYVADVRKLPFKDNEFDLVLCYEVLEHLPFQDFEKALSEIKRVSKKMVIISLPHFSFNILFNFRMPKIRFIRFRLYIPFPIKHKFNGEHYWEIGKKGYSEKRIKRILKKKFFIKKDFREFNNPYHHFFILKKKQKINYKNTKPFSKEENLKKLIKIYNEKTN